MEPPEREGRVVPEGAAAEFRAREPRERGRVVPEPPAAPGRVVPWPARGNVIGPGRVVPELPKVVADVDRAADSARLRGAA